MGAAPGKHFVKAVFRAPAAMADEAAGLLIARGALGCSVGGSHRPGAKQKKIVPLEAFFDRVNRTELRDIARVMSSAGMLASGGPASVARIADPGWSTMWMERFKPLRIGRRFLIVPPWSDVRDPSRLRIVIKPARAFGTGHHATTAGVLRAIEQLSAAQQPFRGALDVGTGSGILAIAARMLGVADVLAIDPDPEALENARQNAALNGIGKGLRFSSIPISRIRRRFDLVVANILASTLISLAPALKRVLARDGMLILAGILKREVPDVMRHYAPPLRRVATITNRGWVTLVLAR